MLNKYFTAPSFLTLWESVKQNNQADSLGDQGFTYLFNQQTDKGKPSPELAINIALVTGRPLLIKGPSGCGKSSLAKAVAVQLNRPFYSTVVNTQTEIKNLLWHLDALQRLGDAHCKKIKSPEFYINPGILWWGFNSEDAQNHLQRTSQSSLKPDEQLNEDRTINPDTGAVILIDEIDKADPDLANNLLVPLGNLQFTVSESGFIHEVVAEEALNEQDLNKKINRWPLIIITTNDERELPDAFSRRCIELHLNYSKDPVYMTQIAQLHFPKVKSTIIEKLVNDILIKIPEDLHPSTAEFLDLIRCIERLSNWDQNEPTLPIEETWNAILESVIAKKESIELNE